MATVNIRIGSGLKKVENMGKKLSREQNRAVIRAGREFAEFVQKSAKIRASKFSFTGQLKESIKVEPPRRNQISVVVDSPYAAAQEFGFSPHKITGWTHSRAGYRFVDWMIAKGFQGSEKQLMSKKIWVGKPFNKSGYFLGPAVDAGLRKIPQILGKKVNAAVRRSVR